MSRETLRSGDNFRFFRFEEATSKNKYFKVEQITDVEPLETKQELKNDACHESDSNVAN